MRKKKKPVRRETPAWEVYRRESSPALFVGIVYADEEESAVVAAIEEHRMRRVDQKRLFARPH